MQRVIQVLESSFTVFGLYALVCAMGFGMVHTVRRKEKWTYVLGVFLFLFYLGNVYQVTGMGTIWDLQRYGLGRAQFHWIPFQVDASIGVTPASFLLNVVMTLPLGIFLPLLWGFDLKRVVVMGFLFSALLEFSQLFNNRASTMEDLLTNTAGAVLGFLIFEKLSMGFPKKALKKGAFMLLVSSFLGVFFFYNPWVLMDWLPETGVVSGDVSASFQVEGQTFDQMFMFRVEQVKSVGAR